MNKNMVHYIKAVTLKSNLEKQHELLSSDLQFTNQEFIENLRLAFLDLKNYGESIHTWTDTHKSVYLSEAAARYDNSVHESLERLSNCLSGEIEHSILEVVYEKHQETIVLDEETGQKYLTIALRAIEEVINHSPDFRLKLGVINKFNILCVSHQQSLRAYLDVAVYDAVNICEHFIETLISEDLLADIRLEMDEIYSELEQLKN